MCLSPHQAGEVERSDRHRGDQEEGQQRLLLVPFSDGDENVPPEQKDPEREPDDQEDLPDPAQVDIFISLMAQVEGETPGQMVLHAEPLSGKRTDDYDEKRNKEDIHSKPLPPHLPPAHCRRDVQPGRQPGRGNPENAELRVPCPRNNVRQNAAQGDPVEGIAFHAVMRGDHAEENLHKDQCRDNPEVLSSPPAATGSIDV